MTDAAKLDVRRLNSPGPVADAFLLSRAFVPIIIGPVGCLPADSEFLTSSGWKRMDAYAPGDEVGIWEDGQVYFEAAEYVKLPSSSPFHVFDHANLHMELSPEHRVLYEDYRGIMRTCSAEEMAAHRSIRKIPTTFHIGPWSARCRMWEAEIRLRVAISADGHIPKIGRQILMTVRKDRKKERLRGLLADAGVIYAERSYPERPTETIFAFSNWPREKSLDFIWSLDSAGLEIVMDECTRWDGLDKHSECRFYTTIKAHADAIQFAAHATGRRASIRAFQDKRNKNWATNYTVFICNKGSYKNSACVRNTTDISSRESPDGFKYCFTTSTGYFVARCRDAIFVTGNSAKTMTALRKLRRIAMQQGGSRDGRGVMRRRSRVGVIRESYPNLEKNTLPSWWKIHPETDGKFVWKAPYTHRLMLILASDAEGHASDVCDFEIEFRAIGDRSVEEACRGWEVNAVLVDEADLQPPELLAFLSGRVGRFSERNPSLVVDPTIILSLNAPYIDNWVFPLAYEQDLTDLLDPVLADALDGRPLIETFIQPGGRAPQAENLHNLPKGYYTIQAALNKHRPDYVARMIDNRPVPLQHGQPVNPAFDHAAHVFPIEWDQERMLIIAFDQGLFAAACACQRLADGQFRTLREAVSFLQPGKTLRKIGPTAFGQMCKAMLNEHFFDLDPARMRVVGDPAAWAARDRDDSEHDWILAFQKALGCRVHKAKTNKEALRHEAIWRCMAERDGYGVDPSCRHLIRAHLGGYRYKNAEMKEGETRGHLEVENTIFTHIADAEQYGAVEGEHVIGDIRGRARAAAAVVLEEDYDVFGQGV